MIAFAMSLCVDDMVVSSAYVINITDVGVSDVYILNNVGDRTLPCGTTVLYWCCVASFDVVCDEIYCV